MIYNHNRSHQTSEVRYVPVSCDLTCSHVALIESFLSPSAQKNNLRFLCFWSSDESFDKWADRVQGNFEEEGKYYSGIVLKVITKKGHATEYLIEYDDGDCEYTISQVMLFFLGLFSGD